MAQDSHHTVTEPLAHKEDIVSRIGQAYGRLPHQQRLIVAIAGAPASGKSTLAEWLVERINSDMPDTTPAVVVPMDGFHLDNAILDARGLRAVKGAPQTFDAVGFRSLLMRLAEPVSEPVQASGSDASDDFAGVIYIPLFDRTMDLARCAGCAVEAHHRIVIVEGNYLLLKRAIWRELAESFDLSVLLDVPLAILEERLIERWIDHGYDREAAKNRALSNDIPNARVVTLESTTAHLTFKSVR